MERQHIFAVNGAPDFLDIIRELLQGEDYNVTTTNFVPETFDQIAVLDPALIIIDLIIGERSGKDLLAHIADEAKTREIPASSSPPTSNFWTSPKQAHSILLSIAPCASRSISMCCSGWSTS